MCIIIDTNVFGDFLKGDENSTPIHEWLKTSKGGIVYGGSVYIKEIRRQPAMRKYLMSKRAKGRVTNIPKDKIKEAMDRLPEGIRSNDQHILALAIASGARLLYTNDEDLKGDFTKKKIIDNPRGKIYSSHKNKNLLTATVCR